MKTTVCSNAPLRLPETFSIEKMQANKGVYVRINSPCDNEFFIIGYGYELYAIGRTVNSIQWHIWKGAEFVKADSIVSISFSN